MALELKRAAISDLLREHPCSIVRATILVVDMLAGHYARRGAALGLASVARKKLAWTFMLMTFGCSFAVQGCHSQKSNEGPTIEFTRVPPAAEGGPDKLDIIQGRVHGAYQNQNIILYVNTGKWLVQPLENEPITTVSADSTWVNSTHVGTEYAAILVEPGYHPLGVMESLPIPGGGVVAVARAEGSGASVSKTIFFSGYEWRIRDAPSARGGGNKYASDNAWLDSTGAMHLRIAKAGDDWTCAEVTLTRSLGYGTYTFVVRDTSKLEAAAVFSMFTYDYAGANEYKREMNIEVTRWGDSADWGDPAAKNSQYVVQPYYLPENTFRFTLPSGLITQSLRWEPGRAVFRTVRGAGAGGKTGLVAEHEFTSGVPSHGVESARMNLYIARRAKSPLKNGAEVVVEKFEYLP